MNWSNATYPFRRGLFAMTGIRWLTKWERRCMAVVAKDIASMPFTVVDGGNGGRGAAALFPIHPRGGTGGPGKAITG